MLTKIMQLPGKNFNDDSNSSNTNIFNGLNLINKVMLDSLQWNNQFTKIQSTHTQSQPAKLSSTPLNQSKNGGIINIINNQIQNLSIKQCKLCKKQCSVQSFICMCRCDHSFCYSCLNAYTISKIKTEERVSCPEPSCSSEIKLSSAIYKNLPAAVKLKYLQWINNNKAKLIDLTNSCLRCLNQLHSGPCKAIFSKENIEQAFNYRKCVNCQTQISISVGINKLNCFVCKSAFCYVCGQIWSLENDHTCQSNQRLVFYQNQVKKSTVQSVNQCCQDSQLKCLKNTGKCLGSCFYCKRCNACIFLGNFMLIPVRLFASIMVLCLYAIMLIPLVIILVGWIFSAIATGMTCYSCQLIEKLSGLWQVVAILGYPFLMIAGIIFALMSLFPGFWLAMRSIIEFYEKALCEMWVFCGPKECCS